MARRENSLQRDDKSEAEIWLHIIMRLVPAEVTHSQATQGRVRRARRVNLRRGFARDLAPDITTGTALPAAGGVTLHLMAMRGHFRAQQGHGALSGGFAQQPAGQASALAGADGNATLQVREGEGGLAITTVEGTEQRE